MSAFSSPIARSPFKWAFTNSSQQISPYLTECQNVQMSVLPRAVNSTDIGEAPYYLMAFEAGGISTAAFVGTDYKNLNWQVNHAAGSLLLLSMADANGDSGGISSVMTVLPGEDSSCLSSQSTSSSLAITSNVTGDLSTCQPWGLTITGGVAPYNITLAALGSTVVTNVTLSVGYDLFTYIDRALPNGKILATVSDSTGQFGKTTELVNTVGSSNVDCNGISSSSGHSSSSGSGSNSKRTKMIIAICVIFGGIIAIGATLLFVLCMRRKFRTARGIESGQDTLPRVFKEPDTIEPSDTFMSPATPFTRSQRKQSMSDNINTENLHEGSPPAIPAGDVTPPPGIMINLHEPSSQHYMQASHSSSDPTSQNISRPATGAGDPAPPENSSPISLNSPIVFNTNGRLVKIHARPRSADDSETRHLISSHAPSQHMPVRLVPNRPSDAEPVIIQHSDGGLVELPPPYLDHRDSEQQPSPPPPDNDTHNVE